MTEKTCRMCRCPLDVMDAPVKSMDCGGDCLECMAHAGDPDCVNSMSDLDVQEHNTMSEWMFNGRRM